jgi:hypothetical protein
MRLGAVVLVARESLTDIDMEALAQFKVNVPVLVNYFEITVPVFILVGKQEIYDHRRKILFTHRTKTFTHFLQRFH